MPPIRGRSGGLSVQKLPENLPKASQKSLQKVSKWLLFGLFWSQMSPGATKVHLRGPRRPQRVQRTAQELPSGAQSGPRDPPRVPNGPPMVPLGRLWAPFGLPWGGFEALWVTFGDPFDTSGRHCGEGADMRQTLACVCQNDIREATLGQTSAGSRHAATNAAPKRAHRQTKSFRSVSRGHRRGQRGPQGPQSPQTGKKVIFAGRRAAG